MTKATFQFDDDNLAAALDFLKRTRSELRQLRMVRVWPDRMQVLDVNQDAFEITGLGYEHPDICKVLDAVNTAYKRETISDPIDDDYKEFKTGRRYPWARDRVM
ncbi:MAG: hypothetical protein MI757_21540 [Pirellulales bacterium]|nr:hypothetical protein [Pirellulales bacterium]